MPETVKTLCQSSRSFVKRAVADVQVHTVQTSWSPDLSRTAAEISKDLARKSSAQQAARDQLAGGAGGGPVMALPLLVSLGPTRFATPRTAAKGTPAAAAARATAKASRFSSAAPVASAIRRPSAAERVMASGQATTAGAGQLDRRRAQPASCATSRPADHGPRQIGLPFERGGRHADDLARDDSCADRGTHFLHGSVDPGCAHEDDARRASPGDGARGADGGVDRADPDRLEHDPAPAGHQPAKRRDLGLEGRDDQRPRHLRPASPGAAGCAPRSGGGSTAGS